ncbi:MAG: PorV/PorQ family protein [Candidatus Firestonebacteria bacterium]
MIFLILLLCVSSVYAQTTGEGGLPGEYLNSFAVSARSFAMGKVNISIADDVFGPYSNPAGLSLLQYGEAGFSLVSFTGTTYNYLGYALPLDPINAVGVSRFAFDSPLAEKTNGLGESLGYYQEKQSSYFISYSRKIIENLYLGGNLKILTQEMDTYSAFGLGLDAGMIYIIQSSKLGLGAVLQNLIPASLKLKNETDTFPINLKVGGYVRLFDDNLLTSVDLSFIDLFKFYNFTFRWHTGLEYHLTYWQDIFLRAGADYKEVSFGLGVEIEGINFDYALGLSNLDTSHRVSLRVKFGMPPSIEAKKVAEEKIALLKERELNKYLISARQYLKLENFEKAKEELNKVLEIDPSNEDAKGILFEVNKVIYGKEAQEHYTLALKYSDEEKYVQAEEEINKILAINPEYPEAKEFLHYNKARMCMANKEYENAESELKEVLKINPNNLKAKEALRRLLDVLNLLK